MILCTGIVADANIEYLVRLSFQPNNMDQQSEIDWY